MSGVLESDSSTRVEKAAPAANEGLMMSRIANQREPPARLPARAGPPRHCPAWFMAEAATGGVGGTATANAKHSAAAVDGAAIKRKPWLFDKSTLSRKSHKICLAALAASTFLTSCAVGPNFKKPAAHHRSPPTTKPAFEFDQCRRWRSPMLCRRSRHSRRVVDSRTPDIESIIVF